jgi:hypothetical protein
MVGLTVLSDLIRVANLISLGYSLTDGSSTLGKLIYEPDPKYSTSHLPADSQSTRMQKVEPTGIMSVTSLFPCLRSYERQINRIAPKPALGRSQMTSSLPLK